MENANGPEMDDVGRPEVRHSTDFPNVPERCRTENLGQSSIYARLNHTDAASRRNRTVRGWPSQPRANSKMAALNRK